MSDTTTLTIEALFQRVESIFLRAGLNAVQSGALARVITAGERDACKSHGIYRIEGALRTVKAAKVKPDAIPEVAEDDGTAIVKVNAMGGFANPAFELGLPALAERAKRLGLAALVINDCTHFSALWPEVEGLTSNGLAGLVMCPSYSTVAPTGGTKPLLGTNPFAFGWPRKDTSPYVFDFATSVAARGEIELHRRARKSLPEGWAVDADGNPTTDPEAALAGAMLPFGGHKGSAIGTMMWGWVAAKSFSLSTKKKLEKPSGALRRTTPRSRLPLSEISDCSRSASASMRSTVSTSRRPTVVSS